MLILAATNDLELAWQLTQPSATGPSHKNQPRRIAALSPHFLFDFSVLLPHSLQTVP